MRACASVVGIVRCKHALAVVVVVVYLNLGHNQSDRASEAEEEEEEEFDGRRSATVARIGRNIVVYIVIVYKEIKSFISLKLMPCAMYRAYNLNALVDE